MFNDNEIFFWETKQNGLIYPKVTFGFICKVFIGHEKQGVALMPKGTSLEGSVMLLHIVDDVANQPLLSADTVLPMQIGRDLQFYASFRKIWLRLGVGRIAKPAFFNNSSDSALACR